VEKRRKQKSSRVAKRKVVVKVDGRKQSKPTGNSGEKIRPTGKNGRKTRRGGGGGEARLIATMGLLSF